MFQPEENGNNSPNGIIDNETNLRQSSSRQASPNQDEKNGNVPEENGKNFVDKGLFRNGMVGQFEHKNGGGVF